MTTCVGQPPTVLTACCCQGSMVVDTTVPARCALLADCGHWGWPPGQSCPHPLPHTLFAPLSIIHTSTEAAAVTLDLSTPPPKSCCKSGGQGLALEGKQGSFLLVPSEQAVGASEGGGAPSPSFFHMPMLFTDL